MANGKLLATCSIKQNKITKINKMKIAKIVIVLVVSLLTFSFTTSYGKRLERTIKKSKVVWKGYKVTGSHQGTIDLQQGSLIFENDKLMGGTFIIDMTTITNTDQEGEYKQKLEGHLKSDDFFGTEKFPTATLALKKVKSTGKNSYIVTGDLTIKEITKTIDFDFSLYENKANATLKVNRAEYDVRYGSNSFFDNLKDKAIYDEFDLVVDLEF